LRRRGLPHHPLCLLCDQEETMHHLLVSCPFSQLVRHDTLSWLRVPCRPPDQDASISDWWLAVRPTIPKTMCKD
jgi:hypothetical protein